MMFAGFRLLIQIVNYMRITVLIQKNVTMVVSVNCKTCRNYITKTGKVKVVIVCTYSQVRVKP